MPPTAVGRSPVGLYSGRVQRVIGILVLVLVVFWIISEPQGAAGTVNAVLADLGDAGSSVVQFLQALT